MKATLLGSPGTATLPSSVGLMPVGAAWVFTRSGGVWTQQGGMLEGNDVAASRAPDLQGYSVALSADGNTAIVGGPGDNNPYYVGDPGIGAAWIYTRSGGVWTQQGPKLVGNDFGWLAGQGTSVALSADGNTALVGGPNQPRIGGLRSHVGLHPQRRSLDPTRAKAGRFRRGWGRRTRHLNRCLRRWKHCDRERPV
jgi:hypothetical protein